MASCAERRTQKETTAGKRKRRKLEEERERENKRGGDSAFQGKRRDATQESLAIGNLNPFFLLKRIQNERKREKLEETCRFSV